MRVGHEATGATGIVLMSLMKSLLMEYSLGSKMLSDSALLDFPSVLVVSPLPSFL